MDLISDNTSLSLVTVVVFRVRNLIGYKEKFGFSLDRKYRQTTKQKNRFENSSEFLNIFQIS